MAQLLSQKNLIYFRGRWCCTCNYQHEYWVQSNDPAITVYV